VHLDEALIARLAGERSFERGERYRAAGRESPLEQVAEWLRATEVGTECLSSGS
jgi:hypothetical protein